MSPRKMYVVALGDAFNGLTLEGPFWDSEQACEYAANNSGGYEEWHIVEVVSPDALNHLE